MRVFALLAVLLSIGTASAGEIGTVKIGVLTDMSSFLADATGPGSVIAARLAAEDAAKLYSDFKIEVQSADHQSKADIGAGIARSWFDQGVDVIVDLTSSPVGIAVTEIGRIKKKVTISTVGTSLITEKYCSPTGFQWTMDTYTYAKSVTAGALAAGGTTWIFITNDNAGGHGLEDSMSEFVRAGGGKILGSLPYPVNTTDFGSYLLSAQASGAKVIALANAGGDMTNTIKQASQFGITGGGQLMVVPTMFITDIHALGLAAAQGVRFASPFYWDDNEATRAWAKRFFALAGRMPTHAQAGDYTALLHYFKAVEAAGTKDGPTVAAKMREIPINDFMTTGGVVRANGSVMRQRLLLEVKKPEDSKYPWDYARVVKRLTAEEAAPRPLAETGCPLLKSE